MITSYEDHPKAVKHNSPISMRLPLHLAQYEGLSIQGAFAHTLEFIPRHNSADPNAVKVTCNGFSIMDTLKDFGLFQGIKTMMLYRKLFLQTLAYATVKQNMSNVDLLQEIYVMTEDVEPWHDPQVIELKLRFNMTVRRQYLDIATGLPFKKADNIQVIFHVCPKTKRIKRVTFNYGSGANGDWSPIGFYEHQLYADMKPQAPESLGFELSLVGYVKSVWSHSDLPILSTGPLAAHGQANPEQFISYLISNALHYARKDQHAPLLTGVTLQQSIKGKEIITKVYLGLRTVQGNDYITSITQCDTIVGVCGSVHEPIIVEVQDWYLVHTPKPKLKPKGKSVLGWAHDYLTKDQPYEINQVQDSIIVKTPLSESALDKLQKDFLAAAPVFKPEIMGNALGGLSDAVATAGAALDNFNVDLEMYDEEDIPMAQPKSQQNLKAGMSLADAVAAARQGRAKQDAVKKDKLELKPTATALGGFFKVQVKKHFNKTVTLNPKAFGQLRMIITRIGTNRVYRTMEMCLNNWDDFLAYVQAERNWQPDCKIPNMGILLHLADEMVEFYLMRSGDKDVNENEQSFKTADEVKTSNKKTIDDIWGSE